MRILGVTEDQLTYLANVAFDFLFLMFGLGGIGLLCLGVVSLCVAIPVWVARCIVDMAVCAWYKLTR